jgi:CheY-like chemotaxis protein/anti-sigma regulatory factor (Ser/Thr protein kinase)
VSDPPLSILIADDSPINTVLLQAVVRKMGHTVILARNGLEAVARFQDSNPDLIFMDIMMPVMDGLTAAQHIRELPMEKWVPIIYLSALDQMRDIVRGLEAGGDDYLVKPSSPPILRAKIRSYARMLRWQREVRASSEELHNWRQDAEEQARLGAHVMSRLTDAAGLRDPMLRHFNMPAETFSGDLLCAARAPGEVLNVLLADAAGHGLAAALTAMPLTQTFYGMTAKGFPLSSIAEVLNRRLKSLLPADRFVAATLAAIDVRNQTVEVWNGGNPDALFVDPRGEIAMQWASHHPPLGLLPDLQFSGVTETLVFHEPGDLVLCSDGLTEAENPAGGCFGIDGVRDCLRQAQGSEERFAGLLRGVKAHLGGHSGRDDISALLVAVPIDRRRHIRLDVPAPAREDHLAEWRLDLSYAAQELRYLDVVPAVLGFATQIHLLKPHQGVLFLIVSELFNNALDHGLLGLESATKNGTGGFDLYMRQRDERLATLRSGRIDIAFLLHQEDSRALLDISMSDSGPGFDYAQCMNNPAALGAGNELACGRGIALVKSLCERVVYSGSGNKVWVRYVVSDLIGASEECAGDAMGQLPS